MRLSWGERRPPAGPRRWPAETAVLWPFALSRLLLLFVGWSARLFPGVADNPLAPGTPSPARLLEIWTRWDAFWYLRLIREGYTLPPQGFSPTAFFPLYPAIVKYVAFWVGPGGYAETAVLITGVILSNLFFLAALLLLFRLTRLKTGDGVVAYRAALYACVAPFSLIFSSFYPEALFLLLTVGAFYAAERGRWGWVALAAFLAALTRSTGVLLALPLLLIWWGQWLRDGAKARHALAPLAAVAGLLAFMLLLQIEVGDAFSFMSAGAVWGNRIDWPWRAFTSPLVQKSIHYVNVGLTLAFTGLSAAAFRLGAAYGLWALLGVIGPLTLKGNLASMTRYLVVVFPVYMILAVLSRGHDRRHETILVVSTMLLSLLMALWSEGFFVA